MKKLPKYNKIRSYDGENSDLSFSITYIGLRKGKIKNKKITKQLKTEKFIVKPDCRNFYIERLENYYQSIGDFMYYDVKKFIKVAYLQPFLIVQGDDIINCQVKVDEIGMYRFIKFKFIVLSNNMCIHNYIGNIQNYMEKQVNKKNGFNFYINNKKSKLKNLYQVIQYYLKKVNLDEKKCYSSMDNMIALTQDFKNIALKYLKRTYIGMNLYIKGPHSLSILSAIYQSEYGNYLYVIQSVSNPDEEYSKLVPQLENSFDIRKQFVLINIFLKKKYTGFQAQLTKTFELKKAYKEILFYEELRDNLLNNSMSSLAISINYFERNSEDINFHNIEKPIKKHILTELKNRKVNPKQFLSMTISETIAKICSEFYEKMKGQ